MNETRPDKLSTGISGLDEILGGGLPRDRLYLIQGNPGVGKTTLALQYLLEGVAAGESCLYITLSETRPELLQVADSHGWSLDKLALVDLSTLEEELVNTAENTLFHPSEVELNRTTKVLLDHVERVRPTRVVFDSLSEMRLLAETSLRYRRQMLALKQYFAGRNVTVMLLDDGTSDGSDLHVQSIAHGVITLETIPLEYGVERRRLKVVKVRGSAFQGGYHDLSIKKGGIHVYPRLVAAKHHRDFVREPTSSGVPEIDRLFGGGLDRGTSTLIIGPAGTGKTTLALQHVIANAARGEQAAIYSFDENLGTMQARAESVGLDLRGLVNSGKVLLHQIDPVALPPGEFAHRIRDTVLRDGTRILVIDSLNGYLSAMQDSKFLVIQLHELLTFLSQQGVVTIMTVAQHGLMGTMNSPVDLTYLADTVVMLRYFEAFGSVKKAISVIKKRSGSHEASIREYSISAGGIRVGPPLAEFQGVLTGVPNFVGSREQIIEAHAAARSKLS